MKKIFSMICCCFLSFLLLNTTVVYASENLLINGSGEEGMTGWVDEDNNLWGTNISYTNHSPIEGETFFWPCNRECSYAFMYQNVNVENFSAGTGMKLTGWLANYDQSPHDQSTLKVQIFDSENNIIYEDYSLQRNPEWHQHSLEFSLPSGASYVRVLCIATRYVGYDNDGYFDDIVLTATENRALPVTITGDKTSAKPGETIQLRATDGIYSKASDYVWSSSYDAIATVDENGLVTMNPDADSNLIDAEVWIYAQNKITQVIGKYFINSERENMPIIITGQPEDACVEKGAIAGFSVVATGENLKYLWQYKKNGVNDWTDWTTKQTADITVAYDKSRDGMSLRCLITDESGNNIYSEEAILTYKPEKFAITVQPESTTVIPGSLASFSLTATGENISYLWQYKKTGENDWTDWNTKTTAAITVAYDKSRNGMSLRCRLTDESQSEIYSDEVTLTYDEPGPEITKQPKNATVNPGTLASYSVSANGSGLTYLWQYRKTGATEWTDWNTKNTADITVAYDKSRNGMSLRCRITDGNGKSVTSEEVTLTYKEGTIVTQQPEDIKVDEGTLAGFSVKATGTKLTYLWQYKKAGATEWTDWTTKTKADITVAYDRSRDGMSLRCKITDGNGEIIYSDVAVLTYEAAGPVITRQPESTSVEADSLASFSVTATGTKLTYLWQYKKAGASKWTDWTTKTKAAITVAYDKSRDGMSLRCVITDGNGKTVTSDEVKLGYTK